MDYNAAALEMHAKYPGKLTVNSLSLIHISMQFNAIIMALAGGQRIFDLLDEKPEVDEGKVCLLYTSRCV